VEKRAMVGSSCTATTGTLQASLRYDPLGRLYETSSGITRFLHDGDAMIGEYGSTGTLLRRHAHGPARCAPSLRHCLELRLSKSRRASRCRC
jgi:hypothetical protein